MDAADAWPLLTTTCRRFLAGTYESTLANVLGMGAKTYQQYIQECLRQVECLDWMKDGETPSPVDAETERRGVMAHIVAATEMNTSLPFLLRAVQMLEGRVNMDPTKHVLARLAVPFLAEQLLRTGADVLLCAGAEDPDAALCRVWTSLDAMACLNTDRIVAMRSVVVSSFLVQCLTQKHWARFDGLPRGAAAALTVLLPWFSTSRDFGSQVNVQEWEARLPPDQVPDGRFRMVAAGAASIMVPDTRSSGAAAVMVSDTTSDAAVSAILKLMHQVPDLIWPVVLKGTAGTIELSLTTPASVARAAQVLTTVASIVPKTEAAFACFRLAMHMVRDRICPPEQVDEDVMMNKMVVRARALASVGCVFSMGIANALVTYDWLPAGNTVEFAAILAMLPYPSVRADLSTMIRRGIHVSAVSESWGHLLKRLRQMMRREPVGALELPGWADVLLDWTHCVRRLVGPDAFLTFHEMVDRYQQRVPGALSFTPDRSEWQCAICHESGDEPAEEPSEERFPSPRVDEATFWGRADTFSPIFDLPGDHEEPPPVPQGPRAPTGARHPWYQTPGKIITLECGHTYHLACVLRMPRNGSQTLACALCRSVTMVGATPPAGSSPNDLLMRMMTQQPSHRRSTLTAIRDHMPSINPPFLEPPDRGITHHEAEMLNRMNGYPLLSYLG